MRRIIEFCCLALAASSMLPAYAADSRLERSSTATRDLIRAMAIERDAREQARRDCAAGTQDLRERILAGKADAEREADAAADRNCFSLIATFNSIPVGIPYAAGVECRPNAQLLVFGRLALMSYSGTDLIELDAEAAESDRRALRKLHAFALSYNRAVLADPRFPYHDLCRVAPDSYSPPFGEKLDPVEWGFRSLEETSDPADMAEAARRGTIASLRRLIEDRPLDMHVPDLLGLTPLAWAVAYDRPEHVQLLLKSEAHPYGEPYWDRPQPLSPITLATNDGREDLLQMMHSAE